MTADTPRRSRSALALRILGLLVLTMLAATVIVAQQRGSGAYLAELSAGDAGEARHFVTALMLRDWAAAGFPDAGRFAADYALRLPVAAAPGAVSLFHVAQGLSLWLVGPSTPAALLLPALLAALLLLAVGLAAAPGAGVLPAVAAAFVLGALPLLRHATITIGLDVSLSLAGLGMVLALDFAARRTGRAAFLPAASVGVASALVAPAGAVFALVPPLGALLGGRPGLLRRPGLWLAVLLTGATAALRWGIAVPAFDGEAVRAALAGLRAGVGTLPLALAVAGLVLGPLNAWRGAPGGAATGGLVALVVAGCLAAGLVADGPALAVLPLAAAVVALAAIGGMGLIGLATSGWTLVAGLLVALLLLLGAMPALMEPTRKGTIGMERAAEAFLARMPASPVLLVAANAPSEAALMAAVAQQDAAGRSFVVPVGALHARDAAGLMAAMDALGASALVVEETPAAAPRTALAEATRAAFPDRFRLIAAFPRSDGTGEAQVYAISTAAVPPDPAAVLRRLKAAPSP